MIKTMMDITSNALEAAREPGGTKAAINPKLNGLYLNGSHLSNADGVNWLSFRGHRYSLKRTKMKVKTIA